MFAGLDEIYIENMGNDLLGMYFRQVFTGKSLSVGLCQSYTV